MGRKKPDGNMCLCQFIESHNHRIVWIGRNPEGSLGPTLKWIQFLFGWGEKQEKANIWIYKHDFRTLLIQSVPIITLISINWFEETQGCWSISVLQCNGDALNLFWSRPAQALLAAHKGTSHSFYVRASTQLGFTAHLFVDITRLAGWRKLDLLSI